MSRRPGDVHVVRNQDNNWVVKQDGERISTHHTQEGADKRAASEARKDGVDRVTHGRDGRLRSKR